MIIEPRTVPIPPFFKQMSKINSRIRVFEKENSVFALYVEDTKFTEQTCLEKHDFVHWKGRRFIKDEVDFEKSKQFIKENMTIIK
jgi:hypothetical protein